jgi:hypothetical protein
VRVDPERWLNSAGLAPEKPLPPPDRARLEAAVLALPPSAQSADGALALDVLRAALLDSVYQLK